MTNNEENDVRADNQQSLTRRHLLKTVGIGAIGLGLPLPTDASVPLDIADSGAPSSIPYSTVQFIAENDSEAVIVEKAARVLPRPNQTACMRLEREFFIHFGPNTFNGVEWGSGHESPSIFNPTELNADQWVRTIKDGGGRMVILVCKHHDGFCMWPSRYTGHTVAASPWREGKGDEVREVADAAHRHGIKMGVYLSPADLYQLRTNPTNPTGYYGNGSNSVNSVIPTEPASFKSDPSRVRTPPDGCKSYEYVVNDYNRYFLNQLYELLTQYGPIEEVWFDGANPDPSVHESYDYEAWYDLIRHLQPQAVIFGKGPDARWVGNEGGIGRTTEWSVIPLPQSPQTFTWPDMTAEDLGSRAKLAPGSYLWWYPAEVNMPILYGWFWAAGKPCRTGADLINNYYTSVGRNGNWLLNLSPDTRGLIPDIQVMAVRQMAQVIAATFARNLAAGGRLTADNSNTAHEPDHALDGNLDTWWEAAPGQTTGSLTLKLPHPVTFDVVCLQEAVDHRGQRIEKFSVDVWDGAQWSEVEQQTTIGHKRLLRLHAAAATDRVRIRIASSRMEPTLAALALYKQADLLAPPILGDRDSSGAVTMSNSDNLAMVYTLNGEMPTVHSSVYRSPISLPQGGIVYAACITADGHLGMVTDKAYPGLVPTGWQVVDVEGHSSSDWESAHHAVDGNLATIWVATGTLPHSITVDMKRMIRIAGFVYLPRQDGESTGTVNTYRFETSQDGTTWTPEVENGRFDNVKNNPIAQEVYFKPVEARYFRFTALSNVDGTDAVSAAEITVIP
jgi:alpha-L-fucosidase